MKKENLNDVVEEVVLSEEELEEVTDSRFNAKNALQVLGATVVGGLAIKGTAQIVKDIKAKIAAKKEGNSEPKKKLFRNPFKKESVETTSETEVNPIVEENNENLG